MEDAILSIAQAASVTPWSESTLYRIAPEPSSPFRKVAGRWVTTESKLLAWVEAGEKPQRRPAESPMPRPHRVRRGSVLASVHELRRDAA